MAMDFTVLENLGFAQILLWLLSFAIVYGILDQLKMPKDKGARTIICLVISFMALFATPSGLIDIISTMSTGLLLFVLAIIMFMILVETAGVKKRIKIGKDKGGDIHAPGAHNIFQIYSKYFAIAFFIIAILIFMGAGGMNLIGFKIDLGSTSVMSLGFLIVIILAILWMVANPD